ncbi:MAG: Glutamate synthase [NADPH] small chain [Eubacteriales bacterium SKADARSKE-1]|nr:Glutamate synthase [NADPH] small chain [Eubacteriales bacterium SKADARSKE-1]
MLNTHSNKNKMPTLDPKTRSKTFSEVATGYTQDLAINEASRCLNCKNKPCVSGCPVSIDIPAFISKIKEKDFLEAFKIISQSSSLPSVCGRVCPQERQCEHNCVRGLKGDSVAIGCLERFISDWYRENQKEPFKKVSQNGHKVAIIGSGPAGLSCAGELAKKGYNVTVFEALHTIGGVLVYGIPEFRLPKSIVESEIKDLSDLGVKFETNTVIGKTLSIMDLFEDGFEYIFIASGAGLPRFMNIPGENLNGVFSANEFLTRINLMKAYKNSNDTPIWNGKNVAVVGGGNVAIDAARCALRLGAENVYIVYRRSEKELPARREEVAHAKEEGITFKLLSNPVKVTGDDTKKVIGLECTKMQLSDNDASGRCSSLPIPNSNYTIECDCVIMAIGTTPNPLIKNTTPDLKTNSHGGIIVDKETGLTSIPNIYAGGDVVTGAATVILAMGAGKSASLAIDQHIKNK